MLPTDALDYHLPPELVATRAASPRDAARLLVLRKRDPDFLMHAQVRDLPELLSPGDRLVFNSSRVLPARLEGRKAPGGGRVQGLFVAERSSDEVPLRHPEWLCLLQAGHLHDGVVVELLSTHGTPSDVRLRLLARDPSEVGGWRVRIESEHPAPTPELLGRVGRTPLPPYILKSRARAGEVVPDAQDRERYQTVFSEGGSVTLHESSAAGTGDAPPPLRAPAAAGEGVLGSVAAPTAGLHFTPELLARLRRAGVHEHSVTLHVGSGTFRPVETDTVESHPIHQEWCSMVPGLADQIGAEQTARVRASPHGSDHDAPTPLAARDGPGRLIGVGTTSIRTLESYALWRDSHPSEPWPSWLPTRLLITPGYRWRWTDAMLTNFHLPRSTLMAMTAALLGEEPLAAAARLRSVYEIAVREKYRFYSYGDAMLILP